MSEESFNGACQVKKGGGKRSLRQCQMGRKWGVGKRKKSVGRTLEKEGVVEIFGQSTEAEAETHVERR